MYICIIFSICILICLVHPKFHWLCQIATTLRQFHWHLFSIGHCAWFYKRGKHGSYLVLAIAPFWSWFELGPKIAIWHSQWNLGYTICLSLNYGGFLSLFHTFCFFPSVHLSLPFALCFTFCAYAFLCVPICRSSMLISSHRLHRW